MRLSVGEAFDLSRTKEVTVGPRAYAVPPLTFGRLEQLLGAAARLGPVAMEAFKSFRIEDLPADIPPEKAAAKALIAFPLEQFDHVAAAIIPGLSPEDWRRHADPFVLVDAGLFLARTHDWPFLKSHLYGKKKGGDTAGDGTMTSALLALAQRFGTTIPELLAFRAEAFFACIDALKARQREAEEELEEKKGEALDKALASDGMAGRELPRGTVTDLDRQMWLVDHPGQELPEEMRPPDGR